MRQLVFAFLIFAFTAAPAFGQTTPPKRDSVTVSVEALRNLKEDFQEQKRKIALQDSLIEEQAHQIELWQEKSRQDSLILDLTEQRLEIKNERIKIRDERINRLEEEKTWEKIKKYIWAGGSLVIGFFIGSAS
jgi:glutamyl-tRNA reductase